MNPLILQRVIFCKTALAQGHFVYYTSLPSNVYLLLLELPLRGLLAAIIARFFDQSALRLVIYNRESIRVRCDKSVPFYNSDFIGNSRLYSILKEVLNNSFPKDPLRPLVFILSAYYHLFSLSLP